MKPDLFKEFVRVCIGNAAFQEQPRDSPLLGLPYSTTHTGVVTMGAGTGFSFLTNSGVTSIKVSQCTAA